MRSVDGLAVASARVDDAVNTRCIIAAIVRTAGPRATDRLIRLPCIREYFVNRCMVGMFPSLPVPPLNKIYECYPCNWPIFRINLSFHAEGPYV